MRIWHAWIPALDNTVFFQQYINSMSKQTASLYPVINISRIKNPNRLYAFFVLGFFIKAIMLIPAAIWLWLVNLALYVMLFLNSFVVLFTGKYWKPTYEMQVLSIALTTKMYFFFFGISNNYPGFSEKISDFSVSFSYPEHPNRWFAFPVLGGLARFMLLIPFLFYFNVIQYAAIYGAIIASFPVLFTGKYPEVFYELVRDNVRQNLSISLYLSGIHDNYPIWWISMNHRAIKIVLIILAVIALLFNFIGRTNSGHNTRQSNYSLPTTNSNY